MSMRAGQVLQGLASIVVMLGPLLETSQGQQTLTTHRLQQMKGRAVGTTGKGGSNISQGRKQANDLSRRASQVLGVERHTLTDLQISDNQPIHE